MTGRFSRKHFLAAAAGFMWLPLQVTAAQGATCPTGLTFNNAGSQTIGQLRDCQLGQVR
jgi:hypothetical protein